MLVNSISEEIASPWFLWEFWCYTAKCI